jgi:fatty acid-binding protein DegV
VEYRDDLGQTLPFDKFYDALKAGKESTTYQLNVSEYAEHFEKFLKQGLDVVHVCLSSGITSGTISAARTAAEMLASEYPDNKVYAVDSLGASSGYGLLMDKLADKRDEGLPRSGAECPGPRKTACASTTGSSPPTSPSTSRAGAFPRRRAFSEEPSTSARS